ncbi:hypothetical protein I656_01201 [Geobacillus sp. WSUCF1]|nr:hypothetical protein I656_01201 [Geobacillus sp. WSUCF1]
MCRKLHQLWIKGVTERGTAECSACPLLSLAEREDENG